jgi:hypothetical protein
MVLLLRNKVTGSAAGWVARTLLLLLLIGITFSVASAQNIGGSVTGVVTKADGTAAVGSRVIVVSLVVASYESISITNISGEYTAADVPVGDFEVIVSSQPGGSDVIVPGSVTSGSSTVVTDVRLP